MSIGRELRSWAPLVLLSLFLASSNVGMVFLRSPLYSAIAYFLPYVLLFAIIGWIVEDAKRRRCVLCFDFAFHLVVWWPISVAWYLIWTRRWVGCLYIVAFLSLFVVPWVAATFAFVALRILRI